MRSFCFVHYMQKNEKTEKKILPEAFCERMRQLLEEEAEEFFRSYEMERAYGLRYNPLKFESGEAFEQRLSEIVKWRLTSVPWCQEGYYYQPEDQPGKHPWHEAGAYYIQEPSAMSAVELLQPQPGERILDLCAAPGGKSTQIAGKMQGQGLLVSNEFYGNRAKILAQNVERMGIGNTVVLNEPAEHLSQGFPEFFDRILVDAPCSGEGMFRKDPGAVQEWGPENVELCASRQREILSHAAEMLKPQGVLVYATCTFAPQENESCLAWFLEKYPQFSAERMEAADSYFSSGRADWAVYGSGHLENVKEEVAKAYRLWPHRLHGEGHFAVRLVKSGSAEEREDFPCAAKRNHGRKMKRKKEDARLEEAVCLFKEFEKNTLKIQLEEKQPGAYVLFSDQLYLLPEEMPELKGWKVVRAGLHLGACRKNRFEPAHALALYLRPEQVRQSVQLTDSKPLKYLHGETVSCCPEQKGWTLVCVAGLSMGWGKASNGVVKNHYPRGLRICY